MCSWGERAQEKPHHPQGAVSSSMEAASAEHLPASPKRPWVSGTVTWKGPGASEGRGFEKDVQFILIPSLEFLYLFLIMHSEVRSRTL